MGHTMAKFYLSKRTNKVVVAGRTFEFDPADYFEPTHSWWCIFSAETDADIAALDEAVAKNLISEISEAEYDEYVVKKKTARVSGNIVNLKTWHGPSQSAPSGKPAQVVEEPARRETAQIEAVDEVVAPKTVATPPPRRRK